MLGGMSDKRKELEWDQRLVACAAGLDLPSTFLRSRNILGVSGQCPQAHGGILGLSCAGRDDPLGHLQLNSMIP